MIIKVDDSNINDLAKLASKLYSTSSNELVVEFSSVINKDDNAFYIIKEEKLIGFAHVSLRKDYVEGTNSSPVGYLEGVYIEPEFRRLGHAKSLIKVCENWAKDKGCTEFASDCELENNLSLQFHLKNGFKVANKIICFTKKL